MTATWLIFRRSMRQTLRTKVGVLFGLLQPMSYLMFFGPLVTESWPDSRWGCARRSAAS
ncbi:hypothetical protein [Cryptosporangium sp. NPDC051539]|uniref:hypothetical protein n=1 Tax=Cryptosporangium sp. NPDC051539 TaxID=3363962 RepID=UPI0037BA0287